MKKTKTEKKLKKISSKHGALEKQARRAMKRIQKFIRKTPGFSFVSGCESDFRFKFNEIPFFCMIKYDFDRAYLHLGMFAEDRGNEAERAPIVSERLTAKGRLGRRARVNDASKLFSRRIEKIVAKLQKLDGVTYPLSRLDYERIRDAFDKKKRNAGKYQTECGEPRGHGGAHDIRCGNEMRK